MQCPVASRVFVLADFASCLRGSGGGTPRSPGCPAYAQPLSPWQQVPTSMALVTDSKGPQPLWQPPPTACLTTSGAPFEVSSITMHTCGGEGGAFHFISLGYAAQAPPRAPNAPGRVLMHEPREALQTSFGGRA